jgi:AcrR family transcriptional regulator
MAARRDPRADDGDGDGDVRPVVAAAAHAESEGLRREGDRKLPLGRKARETRDKLIRAAYEQFSETGYRATKVGDICARAGTSLGSFYQYFDSRADVMTSLVAESIRGTLEQRPWRLSQGAAGLRRILREYVETYVSSAAFQGVWEEATHVDEVPAAVRRDLSRFLSEGVERELARAQRSGNVPATIDPSHLARALMAMADRYCYLTYVFDPPPEPVSIDTSADVLTYVWASSLGIELDEDVATTV